MASNLACVGLDAEDAEAFGRLVDGALAAATPIGTAADVQVLRWQDPSGARLVLGMRGSEVAFLVPSYAGAVGARLANAQTVNDDVTVADIVDERGVEAGSLALCLKEHLLLPAAGRDVGGSASVVALGVSVAVFADEEAFLTSDASLLTPREDNDDGSQAACESESTRMAAESLIAFGTFDEPEQAQPYGQLNGVVLAAQRRTVAATGQDFVVARVRTAGLEADMCLAASDCPDVPAPGAVIGGLVYLVGSLPLPAETDR